MATQYSPKQRNKDEILEIMSLTFGKIGGKTGRWTASIYRIARAIAKLRMNPWGPDEVVLALNMKKKTDDLLSNAIIEL